MQSKGLSLKLQFLLLSCVLSTVLAFGNLDNSTESSGSDSMENQPQVPLEEIGRILRCLYHRRMCWLIKSKSQIIGKL